MRTAETRQGQSEWIAFYEELADKLLPYKNDRTDLISKVQQVFEITGINQPKLERNNQLVDIDPFTIFALFNKSEQEQSNRAKLASAMATVFDISNPVPESFAGVPLADSLNSVFYQFLDENGVREETGIDSAWGLFEAALAFSRNPAPENRSQFERYFAPVVNMKGNDTSKVTMALFWIAPRTFLNLDSCNVWYLYESGKLPDSLIRALPSVGKKISPRDYLEINEKITHYLGQKDGAIKNLQELSQEAWRHSEEADEQKRCAKEGRHGCEVNDAAKIAEKRMARFVEWGREKAGYKDSTMQGYKNVLRNILKKCPSLPAVTPANLFMVEDQECIDNLYHQVKTLEGDADNHSAIALYSRFLSATEEGLAQEEESMAAEEVQTPLNTVLYGPPGTGKTYQTVNYAVRICDPVFYIEEESDYSKLFQRYGELVDEGRVVFCTFHQSYCYEEFIEGVKPIIDDSAELRYEIRPGIFKILCNKALKDEERNYVLIADEINRGNISRVFGELITLLEPSKRLGAQEERTTVLPYSGEPFGVPDNLYVLGTMNTADRSLTQIDTALRRRFEFVEVSPDPSLIEPAILETDEGAIELRLILEAMNARIGALYDRDHAIGHSYLMGVDSFAELKNRFELKIIPLLQEYFYDDYSKIRLVLNDTSDTDGFVVREDLAAQYLGNLGSIEEPLALGRSKNWHPDHFMAIYGSAATDTASE